MKLMAVVRISLGRFDPENFETIRTLLDDSQKSLIPAIRKLSGNLNYYVGIDRENNAMTNVSVWQTLADAQQMASLPEMMALAKSFIDAGVRFERPITNHETLWEI
jgi:quinol monooxygenase YgiN